MINPYENLYIYYFDGILQVDRAIRDNKSFLGTWVAAKMSASLKDDAPTGSGTLFSEQESDTINLEIKIFMQKN
ncbi:MAG: hypothetical protein GXP56_00070 [Deltaproteobacteria bacterium]|nr:hypothetical protein [Deltaproteobacteria bacterium]